MEGREVEVIEPMRRSFIIPQECDDDEIVALYLVKQILEPLSVEAKLRVLAYFTGRYAAAGGRE